MISKVLVFWFCCLVWLVIGSATAAPLPANPLEQAHATPPVVSIAARSGIPIASTREDVAAMGDGALKPFESDAFYPTDKKNALWLKLGFSLAAPLQNNEWQFDFQQNYIDKIELHVQNAQGQWIQHSAGDHIASVDWPVKGLYPRLAVPALPAGEHALWIKIEHTVPTQLTLQLLSAAQSQVNMQHNFLITGALVGLTFLMVILSGYLCIANKDVSTAWYLLYAVCNLCIMVNFTGLGAYLLWPSAGRALELSALTIWLSIIAVATQLQFCRHMFLSVHPWSKLSQWTLGALIIVLLCAAFVALTVYQFDAAFELPFIALPAAHLRMANFLLSGAVGVAAMYWIVLRSAFKGLLTAKIWILAYLPLFVVTGLVIFEHMGMLPMSWLSFYAPMYCLGFEVPMLLLVLHLHHKGQHAKHIESSTLARFDPHTGFLATDEFKPELARLWMLAKKMDKDIAMVYVQMLQGSGRDPLAANQAAVRILRTVAVAQDLVACVGGNVYAIIMPATSMNDALSARLSRLVALGLMAGRDGLADQALRFKVVCGTLRASSESCVELHRLLIAKLKLTSGWDKRSIRYIVWRASDETPDSQQMSELWNDALKESEKAALV
jgi:7TM diverse intracellular signalling/7TMR-DISM extracellular 2